MTMRLSPDPHDQAVAVFDATMLSLPPIALGAAIAQLYQRGRRSLGDERDLFVVSRPSIAARYQAFGLSTVHLAAGTEDFVHQVRARASGAKIQTLTLQGHGAPGEQTIDGGHFELSWHRPDRAQLAELAPLFAEGAIVTLSGCNVAAGPNGEALLRELSVLWNVTVRGGTAVQYPHLPGIEGASIACRPNGAQPICGEETAAEALRALAKAGF